MPKIIENVEEKIFDSVVQLISQHGYSAISMRMIAKESGIAVGTLYNYYADKEKLTTTVILQSWLETLECLEEVFEKKISPDEKLERFLETLYHEIVRRKGVGKELMKHSLYGKEKMQEIKGKVKACFMRLIHEIQAQSNQSLCPKYQERVFGTIMLSMVNLITEFESEEEVNIAYIKDIVRKLL
ncbi:AcrR family transcriptional regulator [Natronobacillus azotifigens]|uniref:TetR/AcrR family transcriptional regulator n=1 Tax=Natronobacillus azotifigens TaxID=472978 RepID=A0A9J6RBL1_9BACI|nr:TetR/AcrR family transcriptional regulator [Natronobacillus azotifigens]MCZ0703072.1 TetR/AcrR family transcriptional regulator [Natronobacillus azotifigens]